MNTQTILVIDDELIVREMIAEALQADGYTVVQAETGGRALEILTSHQIDIVLSDIQLPDTSGIDLAGRIRAQQPGLPIVMVTGLADAGKAIDALKLGVSDYITKPFDLNTLSTSIRNILDKEAEKKQLAWQRDEERRRLRTLFEKCVSPLIVERLLAEPESLCLEGERRTATVLFADIRGFSTICAEIDPIEAVQILNRYLSTMIDTGFKYEGMLAKFQGDGIMIVFGAPVAQSDAALRAVAAAVEMQRELLGINIPSMPDLSLPIGIGINTGEVVAGNVGSERHFEYTVIGDPVNIAKRLESQAGARQILIADTTYDLVKDFVQVQDLGGVRVGGSRNWVHTYNVVGLKDDVHFAALATRRLA
jgi:class 3 adenylate cyclase